MLYTLVGTVSSALYLGCLWGVIQQIMIIRQRRKKYLTREASLGFATKALSVNGFASSFIAFYSVYIYSFLMSEIDYFVLFTRLAASGVTLYVLFELYRDRKSPWERLPFQIAMLFMLASVFVLIFRDQLVYAEKHLSVVLVIFVTAIMLQGGISQILSVMRQRCTGALSIKMNLIFFLKDIMNIMFGAVIGLNDGWPLMLIGAVSAALKMTILTLFSLYPREQLVA
jgi:hypothetical protein